MRILFHFKKFCKGVLHWLNGLYSALYILFYFIISFFIWGVTTVIKKAKSWLRRIKKKADTPKQSVWQRLKVWLTAKYALLSSKMKSLWVFVGNVGKKMVQLVLSWLPYTRHTIKTLSLEKYERILNGERKLIIKRGFASRKQIVHAINSVQNDFALACKNIFYEKLINLDIKITKHRANLAKFETARIVFLENREEFYEILKDFRIRFTKNAKEDLKLWNAYYKLEQNKLRMALEEKQKVLSRQKQAGGVTFYDTLIDIQMGLKLGFAPTMDITLQEYAAYLKKLEKVIEQNERSYNKIKHKRP